MARQPMGPAGLPAPALVCHSREAGSKYVAPAEGKGSI